MLVYLFRFMAHRGASFYNFSMRRVAATSCMWSRYYKERMVDRGGLLAAALKKLAVASSTRMCDDSANKTPSKLILNRNRTADADQHSAIVTGARKL